MEHARREQRLYLYKVGLIMFKYFSLNISLNCICRSVAMTTFEVTEWNSSISSGCNNTNISSSSSGYQRGCSDAKDAHHHLACNGLSNRQQRSLCLRYPSYIDAVRMAAMATISECQFQLRQSIWNCPIVDRRSVFGDIANSGKSVSAV